MRRPSQESLHEMRRDWATMETPFGRKTGSTVVVVLLLVVVVTCAGRKGRKKNKMENGSRLIKEVGITNRHVVTCQTARRTNPMVY